MTANEEPTASRLAFRESKIHLQTFKTLNVFWKRRLLYYSILPSRVVCFSARDEQVKVIAGLG